MKRVRPRSKFLQNHHRTNLQGFSEDECDRCANRHNPSGGPGFRVNEDPDLGSTRRANVRMSCAKNSSAGADQGWNRFPKILQAISSIRHKYMLGRQAIISDCDSIQERVTQLKSTPERGQIPPRRGGISGIEIIGQKRQARDPIERARSMLLEGLVMELNQ